MAKKPINLSDYKVLAEGKTKVIHVGIDPGRVFIHSKDDITAGDGARRDTIENKGVLATTTTVNCFDLLHRHNIPNHCISTVDERTFEASKLNMIPIEVVIRRIATGSFLKRNPEVIEGTILDYPVEFFYKDDTQHDPLMVYDFVREKILFFDPKKPLIGGCIGEMVPTGNARLSTVDINATDGILELARNTFWKLERAWKRQGVTLVDLKIEFGRFRNGQICVGDVIDNDSWRIWPGGDKEAMKDKQVYRNLTNATPKELGKIKENYAWVAEQTAKFVT